MVNEIYVNSILVKTEKPKKQFKNGFEIRCSSCKNLIFRKWFDNSVLRAVYKCKICKSKENNPMYDSEVRKRHGDIISSETYRKRLSKSCSGKLNGFYGKTHSKDAIEKIKRANERYRLSLTDEKRGEISKNMSDGQRRFREKNPAYYSQIKSKAAQRSNCKQLSNSKPNKVEQLVQQFLGPYYTFSVILDKYQFDFGNKDKKILIEVFGDYWHGNPKFYDLNETDNKKKLSDVQRKVQRRDMEKLLFAISNGFKVYVIWEDEILDESFKTKLRGLHEA